MTFFEQKRCKSMAEEIAEKIFINEALFNTFCSVPREPFSPLKAHAYSLNALPMMGNQWISSPLTVAKMTMALELKDVDNVLEIGCGSGYQAAILSKIVRRVFSVERIENLVESAKKTFSTLGLHNILVLHADGQAGWNRYAPYDRILFSAYAQSIPDAIFEQLNDGGMLVAPMLMSNKQFITRFYKKDGEIRKEVLEECLFVPVLDGKE
ncbi:protein-L-isoaspartate(D-aspartate) O-methyltransferase [Campylobacter sp. MIT 97-5078]|uniref:protein-L-isoaspartate(D-aspartate) O-methyltransferase n=1 Tax=Campylobacter sp. MIT 97-5078 TaxID=1548153 RepID=UPI000513D174|nr:protein-L-isoaspartate(D-aspartate) O-methyltransferase [Campylobacter sp. MIT 97-5078]KGI55773.1 protein-L-isoaspartate O-methyltransferase [Campylobacter sp. MIT 97-5078]TQR27743.1 protein-L-isoaspartate(D-aspartate) O-methyltransferase [Campylobacter sp. MIT 97-5078]